MLAQQGLTADDLNGYARTEPSHAAVAQAIASGDADVGLGIEIAAHAKGLGFVPLLQENYHLVCLKSALEQPAIQSLRGFLQSPAWQKTLADTVGYVPTQCGEVLSLRQVLPWWVFEEK